MGMKERKTKWGKRLLAIRLQQGLTIEEAAQKLGTTKATWSRWETGQRVPSRAHQYMIGRLENNTL
jgi:transcriptional regulator with XRE-family HTH domain